MFRFRQATLVKSQFSQKEGDLCRSVLVTVLSAFFYSFLETVARAAEIGFYLRDLSLIGNKAGRLGLFSRFVSNLQSIGSRF